MHEWTLINGLMNKIESIAKSEKARSVKKVKVRLGALSHLSAGHFREHFEEASRGTLAEGAVLEVEELTDETDPNAQNIVLDSLEVAS